MKKRFEKGDIVLLFNLRLRLFLGKLRFRWSGPFQITKVQLMERLKYGVSLLVRSRSMDNG